MGHVRPSWWGRLVEKHPMLPNIIAVAGIVVCLLAGTALLLWIATAKIKGLG
jgi:hypothetical protein